jgi:hypothetical protein
MEGIFSSMATGYFADPTRFGLAVLMFVEILIDPP